LKLELEDSVAQALGRATLQPAEALVDKVNWVARKLSPYTLKFFRSLYGQHFSYILHKNVIALTVFFAVKIYYFFI
jgi:hypothetical protein